MKSKYSEYFNHDRDAEWYDADVRNESHPFRTGYGAILRTIGSRVPRGSTVADLGSGSGNTILSLDSPAAVTAVDVSENMLEIAKRKLSGWNVEYVLDDILHFVDTRELGSYRYILSTYALHHLTPDEKREFLRILAEKTSPDARILIGDLMYENDADLERLTAQYETEYPDIAADIGDEFFWNVDESKGFVLAAGFSASWTRVSDFSWMVELKQPDA